MNGEKDGFGLLFLKCLRVVDNVEGCDFGLGLVTGGVSS